MAVVSDTSPISYLVLIGREAVIAELYGEVVVPEAVRRELVHPRGPDVVRERISGSPSWLKVKATRTGEEGEPWGALPWSLVLKSSEETWKGSIPGNARPFCWRRTKKQISFSSTNEPDAPPPESTA